MLLAASIALALIGYQASRQPTNDLLSGRAPRVATFAKSPERITDGVAAVAGDGWDTHLTSVIDAGGGIEWDMGEPRRVSHAMLTADSNDFYAVLVSNDGVDWTDAWEAPRVAGPGQATRVTSSIDALGRFVRLEPRGGDSAYSVSELVLAFEPEGDFLAGVVHERGNSDRITDRTSFRASLLVALVLALIAFFPRLNPMRTRLGRALAVSVDRTPLLVAVALGLLAITALVYSADYRFRVIDDAYISFQYAKSWATGQGLVFNPGERVEGYTNFLWIALITPFWWLAGGPESFTALVLASTVGLALTGVFLVAAISRVLFDRRVLPVALAILLVTFDDSYITYAVLGLENHLLVVGMLTGLWLSVRRPRGWEAWLGLSFACVGMTRPDALLWVGTYFMAQFSLAKHSSERPSLRALSRTALTFGLAFGAYFACRYAYYGYPLPNTFYLKVGHTFDGVARGLIYVGEFLRDRHGVPLLALGAVFLLRTGWIRWLLLQVVLHVAYVIYVGGDFYPGHRFLIALIPMLALLTAAGFDQLGLQVAGRPRRVWVAVTAAAACVALRSGTLLRGPYVHEIGTWATTIDNNVRYMQWLGSVTRPGSSMILGDIGAAGLFANLQVLDVFGVVDPEVAHQKIEGFGKGKAGHEKLASASAFVARKPTYIKWNYIDHRAIPAEYYIFNDFPRHLYVEGLWVRDDLERGHALDGTRMPMNGEGLAAWTRTGRAFSGDVSSRAQHGQRVISGNQSVFLNSFTGAEGDAATGRIVSPPFELIGDRMRLLVGGGRDITRLRVSLLVAGKAVFSETGTNFETLGRREWDLSELTGQTARIEVVDEAVGAWGHILVDEIVQWSGPCTSSARL